MRKVVRIALLVALVSASLLTAASPAQAATINVKPGQSIQAAINKASPGDTINVAAGVYRENLTIRKNNLKLVGAGDNVNGTVLRPAAKGTGFCSEPGYVSGICVVAKQFDENFNVVTPTVGVQVRGFFVQGFSGDGIISFGADRLLFVNNTAVGNGGYGITSFVSSGSVYDRLVVRNNVGPGFYIGDTHNANFTLKNSVGVGNELGILVREASNGWLFNNTFEGNCVGIFMLNHGGPPDIDDRVQNWDVHDNRILANNKSCSNPEAGGTFGGAGIALLGTKNVDVHDNAIRGHERVDGSAFGGGVVVANSKSDGGDNPVGNTVRNNTFSNNRPWDIFWDGTGTGNTFPGNDCNISKPAFICA